MTSKEKAMWIIGCVVYVICPLDFDFIPFLGWIDDAFVIYLTYQKLHEPPQAGPAVITIDHVG